MTTAIATPRVAAIIIMLFVSASHACLAGPVEDFEKLEARLETANDAYVEAEEASGEVDRQGGKGSVDNRLDILKQMDALVASAGKTTEAGVIAARTFVWSASLELDKAGLFTRLKLVAKYCTNEELLLETLEYVPDAVPLSTTPAPWIKALEGILKRAESKEVKTATLFTIGQVQLSLKQLPQAREAFKRLIALDGDSDYADQAKGYIFEVDHLQVGMVAPDFTTTTLGGEKISLESFRGKVVLLDFWATWCAGCLAETPHLQAADRRFKARPFVILGVSLDDFEEIPKATIELRKLPGIQTWEESGPDNAVATLYNAQFLPVWYLIDKNGVIVARDPFGEKLLPAIEKALGKK